jgi:hypothetical protein
MIARLVSEAEDSLKLEHQVYKYYHAKICAFLKGRTKNEEYAERNFHIQQCLGILNGQYLKKNRKGGYMLA